jgi:hypothetical protein
MRVIWETCWKFDFEQVEHKEWVEAGQVLVTNDSGDGCAVSFASLFGFEELLDTLQSN